MTPAVRRIDVTLDEGRVQKLVALAEARRITEILDSIPGAWERTQEGLEQARRGETIPLSDLL